jgi:hypothetical protein
LSDTSDKAGELPDAGKGWGTEAFPLKKPFKFAGVDYRELTIRVPTGLDIKAYVESRAPGYHELARRLVDADVKVLESMHAADYSRLMRKMGEYIGGE